jgi:hypothetical protein
MEEPDCFCGQPTYYEAPCCRAPVHPLCRDLWILTAINNACHMCRETQTVILSDLILDLPFDQLILCLQRDYINIDQSIVHSWWHFRSRHSDAVALRRDDSQNAMESFPIPSDDDPIEFALNHGLAPPSPSDLPSPSIQRLSSGPTSAGSSILSDDLYPHIPPRTIFRGGRQLQTPGLPPPANACVYLDPPSN